MFLTIKDVILENIEELDVIISDYKPDQNRWFQQKTKYKNIEKIFISEKEFALPPKDNFYLKQPFKFIELVEILYSIFEKLQTKKADRKVLGNICLIISDRKLIYKDKKAVELTEKETDIIVSLFNSEVRGIAKDDMISKVWMLNSNIETHTFETHLYRLRKKIKEKLFLNHFIVNKRGRYYFNHEFIGKKS